jgi:hypothetical protein
MVTAFPAVSKIRKAGGVTAYEGETEARPRTARIKGSNVVVRIFFIFFPFSRHAVSEPFRGEGTKTPSGRERNYK